jgi:hypothetical protein
MGTVFTLTHLMVQDVEYPHWAVHHLPLAAPCPVIPFWGTTPIDGNREPIEGRRIPYTLDFSDVIETQDCKLRQGVLNSHHGLTRALYTVNLVLQVACKPL